MPLHPHLEQMYVRLFGKKALQEQLSHSFRYLSETNESAFSDEWKHLQIYPNMVQSLGLMCFAMLQHHGLKAAHPPPSIVGSGMFILSNEAAKTFASPQKRFPVLLRHTYNLRLAHPFEKGMRSLALEIGKFFHPTFLSGQCAPFFNIETYNAFARATHAISVNDHDTFLSLFREHPSLWNSIRANIMRDPKNPSYMDVHYSSMMTYDLDYMNQTYLVRFQSDHSLINMFPCPSLS